MQTSLFLLIVEIAGTQFYYQRHPSGCREKILIGFVSCRRTCHAIGGGTLRDVLRRYHVLMQNGWYMGVTGLSLLFVIVFRRQWVRLNSTFFIFDTIGLALFVVIGMQKTLMFGYPVWTAIIMGTLTGAFGGVLRDILINEVPLIFRQRMSMARHALPAVWCIGARCCADASRRCSRWHVPSLLWRYACLRSDTIGEFL